MLTIGAIVITALVVALGAVLFGKKLLNKSKKIKFVLAFALLLAAPCIVYAGAPVTFTWDTYPDASEIAGFRLYKSATSGGYVYGAGSANLAATAQPTATAITITGIKAGKYYFVLTAYTADGLETGPSNEVYGRVLPQTPANFKIPAPQ